MIFEIIRQAQYIQFIQCNQLIQQEQVQRRTFKSGCFVELTVGLADFVVLFGLLDLADNKFNNRLLDLRA